VDADGVVERWRLESNKTIPSRVAHERSFVFGATTQMGFSSAAVPKCLLAATEVKLLFTGPPLDDPHSAGSAG
jgi:hypothetical protein